MSGLCKSERPNPAQLAMIVVVWLAINLIASKSEVSLQAQPTDPFPSRESVHVGVLGLFRPQEFRLSAREGEALVVQAGAQSITLEKSSGVESTTIKIADSQVIVMAGDRTLRASSITVTGRQNEPVDFVLAIPGKITRRYRGILEMIPSSGSLMAVVTLDLETAVGSVVAAESDADTPLEALKAQAVATRSYFISGRGRHREFDFCDTTHCQFLRNPPASGSVAAKAVEATRGLVLEYNTHPFAAMYTPSCSGRTRTPSELGLSTGAYPYYAVDCEYCRAHPVRWSSRISVRDAKVLRVSDEMSRLSAVRRLGWSAVPSNDFSKTTDGDHVVLNGTGRGHGIGLCQSGAKAMAAEGASFLEILKHYYPNSSVVLWRR